MAPPPLRRRIAARGGLVRHAAALAALAIALVIVAVLAGYLRLRAGPVDLAAFTPAVERIASAALAPERVEVEAMRLALGQGEDGGVALRLEGLRVIQPGGRTSFRAPVTRARFDIAPLLRGRLRPQEIVVERASAVLSRQPDGRFRFGLTRAAPAAPAPVPDPDGARPADTPADFDAFNRVLAQLNGAADGPLSSLRAFTFENMRLVYVDRSAGRVWRGERADLRIVNAGELRATASVTVRGGGFGAMVVRAEGTRADGGAADMRLTFSGVSTRDLVDQLPALDGLQVLDAPLQGTASVSIAGDGTLTALDASLRAGAGAIRAGAAALPLEGAALAFAVDPARQRFTIRRLSARGPDGAIEASGLMTVDRAEDDSAAGVVAELDVAQLTVAAPQIFAQPQRFADGRLTLRAGFAPTRVEVIQAHLTQGPMRLDATADIGKQPEEGWRGDASVTLHDLAARRLVALWPMPAAPGARSWLDENLESGWVDRADFAAALDADGPRLAGSFAFRDVVAHYLRPMPPITDGRGWGEVDLTSVSLALDDGVVVASDGGRVRLTDSTLTLPDTDDPLSTSYVVAHGVGPAGAALAVLDMQPLGLPGRIGLDPATVSGDLAATARMTLPLLKDLRIEQVAVDVSATVDDARAVVPRLDIPVSADSVAIAANTERMTIEGALTIDGVPVALTLTERFDGDDDGPTTQIEATARIDAAQAAQRGVDPRPVVDGAASVRASMARFADGRVTFEGEADLREAALNAAPLAWSKPAGAPATATARGEAQGAQVTVSALSLSAPDFAFDGAARFLDGRLVEGSLSRLVLDDRIDAEASLRDEGAGGMTARVAGRLFDIAALGEGRGGAAQGPAVDGPPMAVSLALDRLRLPGGLTLRDASGAGRRADGAIAASLTGAVDGGAVAVDYRRDRNDERVFLSAENAGALLRAVDVFDGGIGGTLTVDAAVTRDGAPGLDGNLTLTEFVVSEDPSLARMLDEARLEDARASGIRFDTMRAEFRLADDRVRLRDGVAFGPVIGLTLEGTVDTAGPTVDMTGVFTPAYSLNAAVAGIPIIGDLLTGGEGRGVVAFNFAVRGPADDPRVTVNPLSVLTPGFLRDIFSARGAIPDVPNDPRD